MPDSHLVEEKVASQELVKGSFIHAFRDTVKLPDGKLATREYVAHPGAVMIIPLLEDSNGAIRLVLERQFRYPLGQVMIEFPAGKLDPGESIGKPRYEFMSHCLGAESGAGTIGYDEHVALKAAGRLARLGGRHTSAGRKVEP